MLDGLEDVVYTSDNLIVDLIVSKRTAVEFVLAGASPSLAFALGAGMEFIYIVVDQSTQIEALR